MIGDMKIDLSKILGPGEMTLTYPFWDVVHDNGQDFLVVCFSKGNFVRVTMPDGSFPGPKEYAGITKILDLGMYGGFE